MKRCLFSAGVHRAIAVAMVLWSLGCATPPAVPVPPPVPAAPVLPPGTPQIVAVAVPPAPAAPIPTLPEFLGFGAAETCKKNFSAGLHQALAHLFPGVATNLGGAVPSQPLLPITDPANQTADSPLVLKAAAEAKASEDLAPQKIMALKYLAGLGCLKQYPFVEPALLESLEDPTEAVRYQAVLTISETAGHPCDLCTGKSCCSPAIRKKLQQMVEGCPCPYEPSARIRRVARIALQNCGPPDPIPIEEFLEDLPIEGPDGPDSPEVIEAPGSPISDSSMPSAEHTVGETVGRSLSGSVRPVSAGRVADLQSPVVRWEEVVITKSAFDSESEAKKTAESIWRRLRGESVELPKLDSSQVRTKVRSATSLRARELKPFKPYLSLAEPGEVGPIFETKTEFRIPRLLVRVDQTADETTPSSQPVVTAGSEPGSPPDDSFLPPVPSP